MKPYPTPPAPRRSKADSLRLVERLKRTLAAGAMLSFGGLSLVVGSHLAATNASHTSATGTTSTSQSSSSSSGTSQSGGTNSDSSSSNFSTSSSSSPSTSTDVS